MLKNIAAASTLFLFILLHAWLAVAVEQKLLEDISFETSSEDEERITFKLNSVNIPTIFAMKGEKPRVVFDFPDTKPVRILKNFINTNGKFIKHIRMGIHHEPKPKTRVVFDLQQDKEVEFKHDFDTKKNALIISLYHAGAEPVSKPEVVREEKKDVTPENLVQAEKTVPAQKPETTETLSAQEPGTTKQKETPAIISPPSAPAPPETETQQPEQKLSDAQPDAQQTEEQAPATEPETAATSPAPKMPADEQKETPIILPSEHPAHVQTATQPPGEKEEVKSVPQETEAKQPEPELSDTQPAAQQEEDQTQDPTEAPERDKSSGPPILSSITFDNSTNRGEMVLFKLSEFQPPIVFGVEEGLPRVVCDFKGAEAAVDVPNTIKTDGKYVHTIRIGRENTPKKIRVVLDLTSSKNYDLQQVFFKDDNLFVIIINSQSNTPTREELEKPLK